MSEFFIQVPPDGTGKKIRHEVQLEIDYINATRTPPFNIGEVVYFAQSELTGTVAVDHSGIQHTDQHLHIKLLHGSPEKFVPNEDIQVGGVTVATATVSTDSFYVQTTIAAGGNNPANLQHIDKLGASSVRFAEGSPHFDAFGKLQVSTQHKIAEYIMSYSELEKDFTDTVVVGGATLAYNNDTRGITLANTTVSGDWYQRTSDEYHVYQMGVSQLIEMTISCGDDGKTGLTRKWGYYDDKNGIMFAQVSSGLGIVLRSYATGSIVDVFYPQEEWSVDRLDGAGGEFNGSRITLDLKQNNVYWMDFQRIGTMRFGVVIDGTRILCHSVINANMAVNSFMSSGSLPIRVEQENVSTTASSSEMRVYSSSVFTEGAYNPFKRAFTSSAPATGTVATTTRVALMSIRPAQTYKTFDNRSTIYPLSFSVHNEGTVPVVFELHRNGTTTDGAWVAEGGESTAEMNLTCTDFTGGSKRKSQIIGAGETVNIPFPAFEQNRRGLRRSADITNYSKHVYAVALLSGTTSCDVSMVLNWEEVRD